MSLTNKLGKIATNEKYIKHSYVVDDNSLLGRCKMNDYNIQRLYFINNLVTVYVEFEIKSVLNLWLLEMKLK